MINSDSLSLLIKPSLIVDENCGNNQTTRIYKHLKKNHPMVAKKLTNQNKNNKKKNMKTKHKKPK